MAKYLAPTAAIGALYSTYFGLKKTDDVQTIKSIDEAIRQLNANENTDDALRFISKFDFGAQPVYLSQLSTRSLGILAGLGSELIHSSRVNMQRCKQEANDYLFQKILKQVSLGRDWDNEVDWLSRSPCSEDDLSCEDWQVWRPPQIERFYRILYKLFRETEKGALPTLNVNIVDFLYNAYALFADNVPEVAMLILKILGNVALMDVVYAERIFSSEWLMILSSLVTHGDTLEKRLLAHKICRNGLHALDTVPYKLHSDVYELHVSPGKIEVDIVLIHGLCGSVFYTWRQKDNKSALISECWPKDWLPLDINEPIRILGIDYPSFLLNMSGSAESFPARAERFVNRLSSAGVGCRPVIFICHSMGGLLAKKMLLESEELRKNTVGILFMATPHRGSPIAAWSDYSLFLAPSEDVTFLRVNNEVNEKLNKDFEGVAKDISVITTMVETKESALIGTAKGLVVPAESAVFGQGVLYHIDAVHHEVCKPSERSSPAYRVILNFLRDSIASARKRKPPPNDKTNDPPSSHLDHSIPVHH
ncbi:unnamed protein product, partial [Mesorhabditis spiculigera]